MRKASCLHFMQWINGKPRACLGWIWKTYRLQRWLCLDVCLLKAKEPRGCLMGRAQQPCWPVSSLACPLQKPGTTVSCCPLNLGHASGKAIVTYPGLITSVTRVLGVSSSPCWLHYSPLISFPLSWPLSLEGSADHLFPCTVFPCEGLQMDQMGNSKQSWQGHCTRQGGASGRCFCHSRVQRTDVVTSGGLPWNWATCKTSQPPTPRGSGSQVGSSGGGGSTALMGGDHASQISWHPLSIWVKLMQMNSCTWVSKMPPSVGVSFKEKRSGLVSGEIASGEGQDCAVQHAPKWTWRARGWRGDRVCRAEQSHLE